MNFSLLAIFLQRDCRKGLFTFVADTDGYLMGLISVRKNAINMSEEKILIDFHSAAFTIYLESRRKCFS